ncbi:FAD-dependent oxidoreductase [Pseudomonas taiwanensis]|uniref:FAD-dependent oxidoreductase n=1 Tax=Pseudomonas taiwanensis TaxID=470150 RepID=UPI001648373E|nr:FAD-dependent oxidoreductase [Pseudomonas taiwanensis]MBC3492439.1 FAD-binding oxidoreductase [Pseudomonas taiwanensis]
MGILYGYHLQRLGIDVDVYLPAAQDLNSPPDHLVSTWLCFHSDLQSANLALQGIAELRDIAIDVGIRRVGLETESVIFEWRESHVEAFERFSKACESRGMLVRFSKTSDHPGLPIGTLASARFLQDVALNPARLCQRLCDVMKERGGVITEGVGFEGVQRVDGRYQVAGYKSKNYDLVFVLNERQLDAGDGLNSLYGRNLSYEKAAMIAVPCRDSGQPYDIRPFAQQVDTDGHIYNVQAPHGLAHCVASARRLAEFASAIRLERPAQSWERGSVLPVSCPWIG